MANSKVVWSEGMLLTPQHMQRSEIYLENFTKELQDKLAAQAEAMVKGDGLTPEQIEVYSTIGGTPHLDGQYTVFGEVEQGLDVVELIQNTKTARADRPAEDIQMTITVIE